MSKDSSTKYHQDNKERLQKKLIKNIKVFLKKKKEKNDNTVVKDLPENLRGNKNQKLVEHRRKHYNMRKNTLL